MHATKQPGTQSDVRHPNIRSRQWLDLLQEVSHFARVVVLSKRRVRLVDFVEMKYGIFWIFPEVKGLTIERSSDRASE